MNTTLQIKDSVWNHAMAYANSKGEQLTTIVEHFLMSLEIPQTPVTKNESYRISPKLKGFVTGKDYGKSAEWSMSGLRGIVSAPISDEDARNEYLSQKYGL